MAITLSTKTIQAVKQRLDTKLADYIVQVNDEVENGINIDLPAQILDYAPAVSQLIAFPTFGIIDGPFELQDDTGWGATGWATFSVVVYEQHPDQENLAWRLRRYSEAIARCVLQDRMIDPTFCYGLIFRRADPGPTLGRTDPQTFLSLRTLTFQARSEQDTP